MATRKSTGNPYHAKDGKFTSKTGAAGRGRKSSNVPITYLPSSTGKQYTKASATELLKAQAAEHRRLVAQKKKLQGQKKKLRRGR